MKKNKKGSTLLLAMVIISTVLFAGIGVATILSRQVKDIPAVENKAIAFYLSETIADMADKMDESEIENFDCDSFSHADWCDVEKVGDEYYVKIKVGNDHYKFVKKSDGISGGGEMMGDITVYYNYATAPTDYWRSNGSTQLSWSYGENFDTWVNMAIDTGTWRKYTITGIDKEYINIKLRYRWNSTHIDPEDGGFYYITKEDVYNKSTMVDDGNILPGSP
jgi:hypothetical protein